MPFTFYTKAEYDLLSERFLAERKRADALQEVMDQLRPVWAQGYTSDSMAAQLNGDTLAELWQLLEVDNQTAAVKRLRELLK